MPLNPGFLNNRLPQTSRDPDMFNTPTFRSGGGDPSFVEWVNAEGPSEDFFGLLTQESNSTQPLVRAEDYPVPSERYYDIQRRIRTGEPFPNEPPIRGEGYGGQWAQIDLARRSGEITEEQAQRLFEQAEARRPYGSYDFLTDMFRPQRDPEFRGARELRDVPMPFGDAMDTVRALAVTSDPNAQVDILRESIPGLEVRQDAEGRILVRHPNNQNAGSDSTEGFAYLNQPGVSPQDLFTFISEGVWYAPAARTASAATTPLRRILANVGLSGLTSMGQDVAAGAMGSEQGVDLERAGMAAVAGGAAEGFAPLVGGTSRALQRTQRGEAFFPGTGDVPFPPRNPYEAGTAIRNVGSRGRSFVGEERPMGSIEAARLARTREQGVRLNQAQATQDPQLMETLDQARGGTFGSGAQADIRNRDVRQAQEIANLARRERGQYGEALDLESRIAPDEQAAGLIRDDLTTAFEAQRAAVDQAYNEVRSFSDVNFTGRSLRGLQGDVVDALESSGVVIDPELTPQTVRAIRDMDSLAQRLDEGNLLEFSRDFERTRRLLRQRIEAADPQDARALRQMLGAYDDWVDLAAENQLFDAPPEFFDAYARARQSRADLGSLFEPRGRPGSMEAQVSRTMNRIVTEDRSANQVANWIMGNSRINRSDQALGLVRHLRENFPEQYQVTREAVASRLMFGDNPTMREALLNPSHANINEARAAYSSIYRRLDNELQRNADYLSELFTPAELSRLRNYRNTLRDVIGDTTPSNLRNRSGTGTTVSRTAWTLWNALSNVSGMRLLTQSAARPAQELAGRQAARAAARPAIDFTYYNAPLFTAGAAATGALSTVEMGGEPQDEPIQPNGQ